MPSANVSVTVPVGQAIERVKLMLFRPFKLDKWFIIGFCAWLAHLGEAGYNFNTGGSGSHHDGRSVHDAFVHTRAYVMDNLAWIVPLAIALVILGIAVGVVLLWVSSRGKFMFLHCVALDKAEISEPWHKFARQGQSLFLFRLVLGLIGAIPMLPLLVVAVVMVFKMFERGKPDVAGVLAVVGVVVVMVVVGSVLFVIAKLTKDFVVPIMFLRGNRCLEGWSEFQGLISANVANFVLYLLFQIVLAMAIGALVLVVIIVTCCIAGCVLIIPYLGTVLLLPVLMFKRAYSLHYLAQYGRQYDVFAG